MNENRLYIFISGIMFIIWSLIFLNFYVESVDGFDKRQQFLCKQYANTNHEKEISNDRWKLMGPWENFNWYDSCINHTKKVRQLTQ